MSNGLSSSRDPSDEMLQLYGGQHIVSAIEVFLFAITARCYT